MKVELRKMSRQDKPAIMEILKATPEFLSFEVVVAEEVIDAYLDEPGAAGYQVQVAVVDGGVCGYVCYGETPLTEGTWDIYWIAVSTQRQGLGIGRKLMGLAEARIRKGKGRLVLVETASKPLYEKTRRFYHSLDYDVVCMIPDFYAPGDAKIVFWKRMTPAPVQDESPAA